MGIISELRSAFIDLATNIPGIDISDSVAENLFDFMKFIFTYSITIGIFSKLVIYTLLNLFQGNIIVELIIYILYLLGIYYIRSNIHTLLEDTNELPEFITNFFNPFISPIVNWINSITNLNLSNSDIIIWIFDILVYNISK